MTRFGVVLLRKLYQEFRRGIDASPGDPDGDEFITWLNQVMMMEEDTFNSRADKKTPVQILSKDWEYNVVMVYYIYLREKI